MDGLFGLDYHTFTIVGRCQRTGMLRVAITTSNIVVGFRCPCVKPLVGAASTEVYTDPRLGPFALRPIETGYSCSAAFQQVESNDPHIELRQVGLVDRDGNSAGRTGSLNKPWACHIINQDYVPMGDALAGEHVVQAIATAYEQWGQKAWRSALCGQSKLAKRLAERRVTLRRTTQQLYCYGLHRVFPG